MSTPLELARAIVSDRFSEFDGTVGFGAVKKIAAALIEAAKQREPVEIGRSASSFSAPCKCGVGCYRGQDFCPGCGHPLKWTKEKA